MNFNLEKLHQAYYDFNLEKLPLMSFSKLLSKRSIYLRVKRVEKCNFIFFREEVIFLHSYDIIDNSFNHKL